ncbi:cytochrome P450 [Fomitiporia mediterranea MF3/22]|uniref:cytochrome P450 n=1 Tax=Fomitiporia mediterranea (strain MF3/22) TaxID=694068 RepID=UPI0004407AF0|nr:cytochrome P450 [Fomitiporia mediterranea MF3/22]EJD03263.1 cytochrome P450 [Fomitiporia mediterranea MF3/22]
MYLFQDFGGRVPTLYNPFQPLSTAGFLLPQTPFWRVTGFHWHERQSLYKNAPLNTVVFTPVLYGETCIFSANLDALYQSLALNSDFHKAPNPTLDMLGTNVVTSTGDVWKRHRRITAPAFNHSTYENVWDTTIKVYSEMLDKEGWRNVDETPMADMSKATHKLALFLIAIVGFNIPMSWNEPPRDDSGRLTAQSMILDVAKYIMERGLIPKWAYSLGIEKLKRIDEAYNQFEEFMRERISERETELKKLRAIEGGEANATENLKDVFGRLVNARLSEGKQSLSDRELIGNCFAFTFAGHETSANSLAVTLALLALYPEEQDWVYRSIVDVVGDRELTFDDFDKLDGVLACVYEGVRLFPVAWLMAEIASKDTTLTLSRRDNPEIKEILPVKKGTALYIDTIGIAYDPRLFPDPEEFRPRRWKKSGKSSSAPTALATQADEVSGSSPATTIEGFTGFAYGPRTCLGHKFAKVESVCFLTLLLRDWRVVPVMQAGESKEAWRKRILKPGFGQALLIGEVPLKLVRRK